MPSRRPFARWLEAYFPPSVFFLSCFLVVLFGFLAQWPLEALDTDLWYHLSGGRYLAAHGSLPHDSFFSFLSPPRQGVDYYWLFQAIVYRLYQLGGYTGLVLFRALICAGIAGMVVLLVFQKEKQAGVAVWRVYVVVLCLLIVLTRFFTLRPHLFTYLFILIFLWVLEKHPSLAPALPLAAVFWSNVHGVSYPILWLILGAYGLEQALHKLGSRRAGRAGPGLFWLLLSALAVLATPHGLKLLQVPFVSTDDASKYIGELYRPGLVELLSVQVTGFVPTETTLFVLLLATGILSFAAACQRRALRASHAVLLLGGCVLFFRAQRFVCELALLSLPLLKASPIFEKGMLKQAPRFVYGAIAVVGMIMPIATLANYFPNKPAFPVSGDKLPRGVCAFLNAAGAGGRVLNFPNNGGYLQWMLRPGYKIYSDLQAPFLFHDEDIRLIRDIYSGQSPEALARVLLDYRPDFIMAPIESVRLGKVIKQRQPQFVPVFFDDAEVLYADRRLHPEIARQYALKVIDPFALPGEHPGTIVNGDGKEALPKDRVRLMLELRRLLAVFPRAGLANLLAAWVYNDEGRYDQGWELARRAVLDFPNVPEGHLLYACALSGLGEHAQALAACGRAVARSSAGSKGYYYRKTGQAYLKQGDNRRGYALLKSHTDLYIPSTSAEDIFYLGHAAFLAGHPQEARKILDYLLKFRTGAGSKEPWVAQLKADLNALGLSQ